MVDPTTTVDAPTNPPRRFRKLRIAASVLFGVLTVAMCVLWVRSYWIEIGMSARFVDMPSNNTRYFGYQMVTAYCGGGQFAFNLVSGNGGWSGPEANAGVELDQSEYYYDREEDEAWLMFNYGVDDFSQVPRVLGIPGCYFQFNEDLGDIWFSAPMWLITASTVTLAAATWFFSSVTITRRFSIRTMLIATTLVAVVLGLGVWLAR